MPMKHFTQQKTTLPNSFLIDSSDMQLIHVKPQTIKNILSFSRSLSVIETSSMKKSILFLN